MARIRRRIPVLLGFALTGAAVTVGYGLLRAYGPAVALPLGVFGMFCSSFARICGQAPQQLGALRATVQILSLDRAIASTAEASILATAFIGGSLWVIPPTMVIWRIYPFLPARRAVAEAYRQALRLVRDLHMLVQVLASAFDHRRRVGSPRPDPSPCHPRHDRGSAYRRHGNPARLRRGQQSRRPGDHPAGNSRLNLGGLIALSDLLEHSPPAESRVAERLLRRIRPVILAPGRVEVTDDPRCASPYRPRH